MMLTHHAHVLRADAPRTVTIALDEKNESYDSFFERFGIDDSRELTLQAHTRPRETKEKLFVVRTDFITVEAQNALLKLLEEPPETSRFLFVVPKDLTLLDTLLSRVEGIENDVEEASESTFDDFLVLSTKERISLIESSMKKKDLEWQRAMKTGLIRHLSEGRAVPNYAELEFVSRVLLTRGASNKMLLEHAALLL